MIQGYIVEAIVFRPKHRSIRYVLPLCARAHTHAHTRTDTDTQTYPHIYPHTRTDRPIQNLVSFQVSEQCFLSLVALLLGEGGE